MPRADRLIELVHLLGSGRRRTAVELGTLLGISIRTVYRDLASLSSRRIAIVCEDGGYRLMDGSRMRPLALAPEEHALLQLLLENPAIGCAPSLRKRLELLRAKLSAAGNGDETAFATMALEGPDRTGPIDSGILESLEHAIRATRTVSILYVSLSDGVERWRHLDPYTLVHRGEAWYAAGWCHKHESVRIFRLDRIRGLQQTAMRFERPADFDAGALLAGAWSVFHGNEPVVAVVQFDRTVAPLIERARHHASEEKRTLSDGTLEYRVRLDHLDELARWIAGFGGTSRAIEPPELVARVEAIAAGTLAVHESPKAAGTRKGPRRAVRGEAIGEPTRKTGNDVATRTTSPLPRGERGQG